MFPICLARFFRFIQPSSQPAIQFLGVGEIMSGNGQESDKNCTTIKLAKTCSFILPSIKCVKRLSSKQTACASEKQGQMCPCSCRGRKHLLHRPSGATSFNAPMQFSQKLRYCDSRGLLHAAHAGGKKKWRTQEKRLTTWSSVNGKRQRRGKIFFEYEKIFNKILHVVAVFFHAFAKSPYW